MSTLLQVPSDLGYHNHDRFVKEMELVSSKPVRCSSSYIPRKPPKINIERAKSAQHSDQTQTEDKHKFGMAQAGQLVCQVNSLFRDTRARLQSSDTEKSEWENIDFDYFDDSDDDLLVKESSVGWRKTFDVAEHYIKICNDVNVTPCRSFQRQMKSPAVNISHCGLTSKDVKAISIVLVNNTFVTDLAITDNDFGDSGMTYLADAVKENVFITSLDVSGNKFGSRGFKYLVQGLLCNKTITRLCAARNLLDKNSAKDLKLLLERNDCIVDLDLSGNKLDEDTGCIIAPSIASNVALKRLNLSWNHIRRTGATAIAKAVCSNVELEELDLSWNGLAEEGSRAFGTYIQKNHTLLDLNISNNRIGFRHLGLFLKGMKENDTLQTLKIDSNPFATDGAITILKTFEASTKTALKTLDLQDVPVNNDFLELAETLRVTRNLSVIHRDPNKKMIEHVFREIKVEEYDPVLLLFEYMRQENIRLIDLFRLLDKNHDNEITHHELRDGFREMNIDLTDQQIRNFIEMLDKDDSKTINISEMKIGRRIATNKRMICEEEGRETMSGIIKHMQALVKRAREEKMKLRSEARLEQKNKVNRELKVQNQASRPVSAASSAPSNKGKDAMSLMSGLETATQSSMSEVESSVSQAVTTAIPRVSAAPPATSTQPSSYDSRNSTVFRNVPRHHSSSDESSDSLSDEDTDLWRCKKAKYFSSSKREDSMVTELPDEIKSPPRNNGFSKFVQPSGSVKRKINNVWGSVLTEQCLTENMKSVEVYKNPDLVNSDRKVEKYDFTNAYDDDRPDAIDIFPKTTNDPFENVIASDHEGDYLSHRQGTKRKRKAKERIGRRHVKDRLNDYPPVKTLREISDEPVTVEDSEQDIVSYIAKELFERKVELIAKIVRVVGKEKALEVFAEVLKIEENGGMLTNDGFRRRAPGGVYFTLMKTDKGLTAEQHDEIFAEEERNYKEWCKKAKKERRNKARKMKRMYKKLPQSKLLETGHKNDECSTSNRKGEDDMNSDNSSGEDDGNMDLMDSVNDRQTNKGALITDIGKEESGADIIDLGLDEGEIID